MTHPITTAVYTQLLMTLCISPPDGDIIEHGRKLFRVQTVKRWRGFWEVLAVFPFEGELS